MERKCPYTGLDAQLANLGREAQRLGSERLDFKLAREFIMDPTKSHLLTRSEFDPTCAAIIIIHTLKQALW